MIIKTFLAPLFRDNIKYFRIRNWVQKNRFCYTSSKVISKMFVWSIRDVLCKIRTNIGKEIIQAIYYVIFIWN